MCTQAWGAGAEIFLSLLNSTIKDRTLFVWKCAVTRWDARLFRLFREQPRQPSRRECGWEGQVKWRARAFRFKHALVDQGRNDTARLPLAGANDIGYVAARQLAAIEHGFENTSRFRRKMAQSGLFLGPHENERKKRSGVFSGDGRGRV